MISIGGALVPRYIVGLLLFLIIVIIGKFISEGALNRLTDDQKQALIDGFGAFRRFSLVPVLIVVVLYLVATLFFTLPQASTLFLLIVFVYVVFVNILLLRRLRTLSMPASYSRAIRFVRLLNLLGIGLLFLSVLYTQ